MKYGQLYEEGIRRLKAAGVEEADSDCFILFSEAFGLSRSGFFFKKQEELPSTELDKLELYFEWLKRREGHEPVQYIIGNQEFCGLTFKVDERVLIPRLDTEVLVDQCLKQGTKDKTLLDLCTGSGCILISLVKLGGIREATGTDLSADALAVARDNAEQNDVSVRLLQGDLFAPIENETFDIITANPPYIAESERGELAPEVLDHEPELALFADHDGLFMYERIIKDLNKHLNPGGTALFEIGCSQAQAVCRLCVEAGFVNVRVIKDLAGLDRVVIMNSPV